MARWGGLILLLFLAALPGSYAVRFVGARGPFGSFEGVRANIETAYGEGSPYFLAYVEVNLSQGVVMVGYAVLPPGLWLINETPVRLTSTSAYVFSGAASQNGSLRISMYGPPLPSGSRHTYELVDRGSGWSAYVDGRLIRVYGDLPSSACCARFGVSPAGRLAQNITFDELAELQSTGWSALPAGWRDVAGPREEGVAETPDVNASFLVGPNLPASTDSQLWPLYHLALVSFENSTGIVAANGTYVTAYARSGTLNSTLYQFWGWAGPDYVGKGNPVTFPIFSSGTERALYNESYLLRLKVRGPLSSLCRVEGGPVNLTVIPGLPEAAYVPAGNYTIAGSADGLRLVSSPASISVSSPSDVAVSMWFNNGSVSIVDPLEVPISGARVSSGLMSWETNSSGAVQVIGNPGSIPLSAQWRNWVFSGQLAPSGRLALKADSPVVWVARAPLWLQLAAVVLGKLFRRDQAHGFPCRRKQRPFRSRGQRRSNRRNELLPRSPALFWMDRRT